MRGEDGVAGEGRLVGEAKFHPLSRFTLTNIYSNWICTTFLISVLHWSFIWILVSNVINPESNGKTL